MGPAMLVMGLLSGAYHASNNYLSQVFDFVGMFLLTFWFLVINLRRNGWIVAASQKQLFGGLVVAGIGAVHLMYLRHWPFQWLIAAAAAAIVVTEVSARLRSRAERVSPRHLVTSLVLLGAAQAASLADLKRVACDPDNHFVQGHAVWNLVSAQALYFACQHYRQLRYQA
jgi:hypothetical protein